MVSGAEIRVNKCAQVRARAAKLQFTFLAALSPEERKKVRERKKERKAHVCTRRCDRSLAARDICRFSISRAALAAD